MGLASRVLLMGLMIAAAGCADPAPGHIASTRAPIEQGQVAILLELDGPGELICADGLGHVAVLGPEFTSDSTFIHLELSMAAGYIDCVAKPAGAEALVTSFSLPSWPGPDEVTLPAQEARGTAYLRSEQAVVITARFGWRNGHACAAAPECASNVCQLSSGVCCDVECAGSCASGTCAPTGLLVVTSGRGIIDCADVNYTNFPTIFSYGPVTEFLLPLASGRIWCTASASDRAAVRSIHAGSIPLLAPGHSPVYEAFSFHFEIPPGERGRLEVRFGFANGESCDASVADPGEYCLSGICSVAPGYLAGTCCDIAGCREKGGECGSGMCSLRPITIRIDGPGRVSCGEDHWVFPRPRWWSLEENTRADGTFVADTLWIRSTRVICVAEAAVDKSARVKAYAGSSASAPGEANMTVRFHANDMGASSHDFTFGLEDEQPCAPSAEPVGIECMSGHCWDGQGDNNVCCDRACGANCRDGRCMDLLPPAKLEILVEGPGSVRCNTAGELWKKEPVRFDSRKQGRTAGMLEMRAGEIECLAEANVGAALVELATVNTQPRRFDLEKGEIAFDVPSGAAESLFAKFRAAKGRSCDPAAASPGLECESGHCWDRSDGTGVCCAQSCGGDCSTGDCSVAVLTVRLDGKGSITCRDQIGHERTATGDGFLADGTFASQDLSFAAGTVACKASPGVKQYWMTQGGFVSSRDEVPELSMAEMEIRLDGDTTKRALNVVFGLNSGAFCDSTDPQPGSACMSDQCWNGAFADVCCAVACTGDCSTGRCRFGLLTLRVDGPGAVRCTDGQNQKKPIISEQTLPDGQHKTAPVPVAPGRVTCVATAHSDRGGIMEFETSEGFESVPQLPARALATGVLTIPEGEARTVTVTFGQGNGEHCGEHSEGGDCLSGHCWHSGKEHICCDQACGADCSSGVCQSRCTAATANELCQSDEYCDEGSGECRKRCPEAPCLLSEYCDLGTGACRGQGCTAESEGTVCELAERCDELTGHCVLNRATGSGCGCREGGGGAGAAWFGLLLPWVVTSWKRKRTCVRG